MNKNTDTIKVFLAIGFGIVGAISTLNIGMGGYLLSMLIGTLCFILFGGRSRVFLTSVFATTLIVLILILSANSKFGPKDVEALMYLLISIIIPISIAQVVNGSKVTK